jgi:hypothetical protein
MIQSKFIADIIDLLLDDETIKKQIPFLNDTAYEYTGVGLFVRFSYTYGIENFRDVNNMSILDAVEIKSPELAIGADAQIFFNDGIIDYLEIWSFDGDYPAKELKNYTLIQKWDGSAKRQIIVS